MTTARIRKAIRHLLEHFLPEKLFLQYFYFRVFKKFINFNNPRAFSEKIQWHKLYGYEPIHSLLADKAKVREYIRIKIGAQYLIPLVTIYENPDDINFNELPDAFILKTNHGSGQNIIVEDKTKYSEEWVQKKFHQWMRFSQYPSTKEKQYKNIKAKIVVEKYLTDSSGTLPYDYKFHCFNGRVEAIQVDMGRYVKHRRNFYDTNWNLLPFTFCTHSGGRPKYPNGPDIEKPETLDHMIMIAQKLSVNFSYLRVDLYDVNSKVYFGELTFHPASGKAKFLPKEYDLEWGKMFHLPSR